MAHNHDIKALVDQGDYLKAYNLATNNTIEDSRSINPEQVYDIASMLDNSRTMISSLEDKIADYETSMRRVRTTAFQFEEKEHALQLEKNNLSDLCDTLEQLVQNLTIPDRVQTAMLDGSIDDEAAIEELETSLNMLENVLAYEPGPDIQHIRCISEQKAKAHDVKLKFYARFYDHFNRYTDDFSPEHSENFIRMYLDLSSQASAQILSQIYPEVLIKVKRNFDKFMKQHLTNIREFKPPKQPKCGVLAVVKNFESFAKQVESIIKSTGERRRDIDRWYLELVAELFKVIDQIEHSKTPQEMIRLENYNYLHDVLRSIKVPCLEAQRREANFQYKAALNAYVTRYFGRPLEKLNIFFEGVQAKVAQGVKEEEISFQLAFSKQELRKVLQLVNLKEVRKGLEVMYKRIEKHASEPDSNLTQVIWHAMQDEFLSQYKAIQSMIERCYPGTNLSLTFTIDNLLRVFEDIARSH